MLSGYDSEAVGFDSVVESTRTANETSSQTTEYASSSAGSQTATQKTSGIQTSEEELSIVKDVPSYSTSSLNAFLRKVIPSVYEALAENEIEFAPNINNSNDDDDDEAIIANLYQTIDNSDFTNKELKSFGSGDQKTKSVLSMSWSSAGNTLAICLGHGSHDEWCNHEGLIRVYIAKRSAGDKFCHFYDITQSKCITVIQYHPITAALLAYATISGEVVVQNLRNASELSLGDGAVLTSPLGTHGSRRVSALKWADGNLTKRLLMLQKPGSLKRRGASDHVLISTGIDGTMVIWQVNPNLDVFNGIIFFNLASESINKVHIPDVTCFDFLMPDKDNAIDTTGDIFVVGCTSGQLIVCNTNAGICPSKNPTTGSLEPHQSCILEVSFCNQRRGIFASISTDSELRIYNHDQISPLKVICFEESLSCMAWVPSSTFLIILGLGKVNENGEDLVVYNLNNCKPQPIEGLQNENIAMASSTTAIKINSSSQNLVAVGNRQGKVTIWSIPIKNKFHHKETESTN